MAKRTSKPALAARADNAQEAWHAPPPAIAIRPSQGTHPMIDGVPPATKPRRRRRS